MDLCVTSPPFFGLRDYGVQGQIGLEETPEEWVARLVQVFAEVRRLLRPWGSLWIECADTYASGMRSVYARDAKWHARASERRPPTPPGRKALDLLGTPWRLAEALVADGWYLRGCYVWAKPNPLPESVAGWRWERCRRKVAPRPLSQQAGSREEGGVCARWEPCPGCDACRANDGLVLRRGAGRCAIAHSYVFQLAKAPQYFYDSYAVREEWAGQPDDKEDGVLCGRNVRSVWVIPTEQNSLALCRVCGAFWRRGAPAQHCSQPVVAHYAAYPTALVDRIIRLATSEKGNCAQCGAPWARVVERGELQLQPAARRYVSLDVFRPELVRQGGTRQGNLACDGVVTGHYYPCLSHGFRPTCNCGAPSSPAVVLDPFIGSGTTAVVARSLGRRCVGIDINHDYVEMAARRLELPEAVEQAAETSREPVQLVLA